MKTAKDFYLPEDDAYVRRVYRELHRIPELELELPKTCAYVKRELEEIHIPYSLEYAPSGIVGYLGYGTDDPKEAPAVGEAGHVFTIGLRADMDALPIEEESGVEFSSKHPGCMHACGHDAHTAMLLCAARALKRAELAGELPCRVKLLFQPNEEGEGSGAGIMVDNGVLNDVDFVCGQHIQQQMHTGEVGWHKGPYMAACHTYSIDFYGKSAHATLPQEAHDALAMGVKAINDIYMMKAREIGPFAEHIISVGAFHAGTVHNIIAPHARLKVSVRTFDMELDRFIENRIKQICKNAADELGGTVEFEDGCSATVVDNAPEVVDLVIKAAKKVVPEGKIVELDKQMGSEDFSRYLAVRPGAFTRIGTGNPEKGCTGVPHTSTLVLDQDAFLTGSMLLAQIAMDAADL